MKNLVVLFIAIFTYNNLQAQEWKLLDDNEEFTVYIKANSGKSAWFRFEYNNEFTKTISYEDYRVKKMLTLIEFDCSKKMMGTLAEHLYDKDGELTYSKDEGEYARMRNVIPDTTGEFLFNSFCK